MTEGVGATGLGRQSGTTNCQPHDLGNGRRGVEGVKRRPMVEKDLAMRTHGASLFDIGSQRGPDLVI